MMIYEPTESEIFHYGGVRHSHLYNRNDQSLCAATAGGYRRGLGMRLAAMGGSSSFQDPYNFDSCKMWLDAIWNRQKGQSSQDQTVGTNWTDISGNANNGVLNNASWDGTTGVNINGINGYGVGYNGGITNEYTIEICGKFDSEYGYTARLTAENPYPTYSINAFNRPSVYGHGVDSMITQPISPTTKFYLTFTFKDLFVSCYYNGNYYGGINVLSNASSVVMATTGNRISGGRGWNGKLYFIRRHSKAFDEQEVKRVYAIDKARFGIA